MSKAEMLSCLKAALSDAQHERNILTVDKNSVMEKLNWQLDCLNKEIAAIEMSIARYAE